MFSPVTGQEVEESPYLAVGATYEVLEMYVDAAGRSELRLLLQDGDNGLWPTNGFETTDSSIPPSWKCVLQSDGYLRFAPEAWLVPGYWERYLDREAEALDIYDNIVDRIADGGEGL